MNSSTHHNHDSGDDLEDRLRRRLRSTPIDLPSAPGPYAAADRAHQRSRRRRSGLVAAAAVALVGGLAAPSLLGDDPDEGVNTNVAAPIDTNGVELDWQVHDDGLSQGLVTDEGADGFYALSTAPGARWQDFPDGNVPKALYRWSDGAWQPIELGDDDPNVAKVSERDGSLYALSTAADTGGPIGSVSTDGGESWTPVPLGSIQPPSDDVAWHMVVGLELASTADTTIGVVSTRFVPPGDDLFDELSEEPEAGHGYYWRTSDAGVELIEYYEDLEEANADGADPDAPASTMAPDGDPESAELSEEERQARVEAVEPSEAVVRTIPWSELGVSDATAVQTQVTTYRADGDTWTPITDGPGPGVGSGSLISTDSGFLLQTMSDEFETPQAQVFHSTDGAEWQPVSTPDTEWGQTVLAPNGHLLHVAHSDGGRLSDFTVSVSTDLGGSWSPIDLEALAPDAADQREVWVNPKSGPLGVGLMVHGTDGGDDSTSRLLFSTDLQSWSTTDLSALTPENTPYLGDVLIGTDHIVVQAAGGPSDPDDDEPGPSATLVATPVR